MTEVRLTIQEQDRRHALGSNKRERAKVDICGYKDSEQEREADPGEPPPQPSARDPYSVALGVVEAHRASRCMNCAICDESVKSSTKRIADFGINIRELGSCSSWPRRMTRVSVVPPESVACPCCRQ